MKRTYIYTAAMGILLSTSVHAQTEITQKEIYTDQRGNITHAVTPDSLVIPGIDQKQRDASIQDKTITGTETIPADKLQGNQPSTIRKDD